ncbi:MAG TPA: GNAT family N-acetyltransferase [Candidatus Hydrogenedentes bacterium]|nr:GNAT family N-acetyltransferase [Candidatus Hydrogenedentota bacterium]HPG66224.1 GNAT family N-acetyltransferase [Candidatus Hydrogenedentota bacterium]
MIRGEHSVTRTADQDDALALKRLYASGRPRSALLDRKREFLVPTVDEIRELLAKKDLQQGAFYAVEDMAGDVRGFCSLRGAHPEVAYAELVLLLIDEADYATPLADEVYAYLRRRAFDHMQLNKLIAQCLECERGYRDLLIRHGFESAGIQRDVHYTGGRWYYLESFELFSRHRDAQGAAPV